MTRPADIAARILGRLPRTSFSRPGRDPRIYIVPTRYGLIFFLVLVGLLVGSVNYNNNMAFLLTFLLASIAFVSLIHTQRNLKGLTVVAARAEPVFAGDPAVFEVVVGVDEGRRPAVKWKLPEGPAEPANLKPGRNNRVPLKTPTRRRGRLKPGRLIVWSRYPLGLFRAWSEMEFEADCLVYPRPADGPVDLEFGRTADGDGDGGLPSPGVDDFKEIRDYRPGDPPQRIAWKQSSRGHGLLTKEFQAELGASTLLDWNRVGEGGVEWKLSRLCAMVLKAHSLNLDYGLNLPGRRIEPDRGQAHKRDCLKALALFGSAAPRVGS